MLETELSMSLKCVTPSCSGYLLIQIHSVPYYLQNDDDDDDDDDADDDDDEDEDEDDDDDLFSKKYISYVTKMITGI